MANPGFDDREHPRAADGTFARKSHAESPDVTLDDPVPPDGLSSLGHMELPRRSFVSLAHVGTLDASQKGLAISMSYEGGAQGLSVSVSPDDWVRIARLGGSPTHWLARGDGRCWKLLDAHAIDRDDRAEIGQWARDNGLAETHDRFEVAYYDDEMECEMTASFASRQEAEEEVDANEWGLSDGSQPQVAHVERIVATRRLADLHGSDHYIASPAYDLILPLVAAQRGDDGVWWDDHHDPDRLSAPRGVLTSDAVGAAVAGRRGDG